MLKITQVQLVRVVVLSSSILGKFKVTWQDGVSEEFNFTFTEGLKLNEYVWKHLVLNKVNVEVHFVEDPSNPKYKLVDTRHFVEANQLVKLEQREVLWNL